MNSARNHLAMNEIKIVGLEGKANISISTVVLRVLMHEPPVEIIDLKVQVIGGVVWYHVWADIYPENLHILRQRILTNHLMNQACLPPDSQCSAAISESPSPLPCRYHILKSAGKGS